MKKHGVAKISSAGRGSAPARRMAPPPVTVLHIDDDPNDTELLRTATRKAGVECILHNVSDGEQAVAFLSRRGEYANRERYQTPALILLDLKMPRATGFEVLRWIRNHPELRGIPVIVLSGSELHDDMRRAYAVGANAYLVKPMGFEGLVKLVRNISAVWLTAPLANQISLNQGLLEHERSE